MDTDATEASARPSSAELFGDFGLRWEVFDEFEVPIDPLMAVDGD